MQICLCQCIFASYYCYWVPGDFGCLYACCDSEFLPGPWSVEVQVEMFPDLLRVMGVGVRLRLVENISITLPPTRALPLSTADLTDEQWLLLELAAFRSEEQNLKEAEDEAKAAVMEQRGEWTQALGESTLTRMGSFPVGPCRIRRGKGFDDPVVLDCVPPTQPSNKKQRTQYCSRLHSAFLRSVPSRHIDICQAQLDIICVDIITTRIIGRA